MELYGTIGMVHLQGTGKESQAFIKPLRPLTGPNDLAQRAALAVVALAAARIWMADVVARVWRIPPRFGVSSFLMAASILLADIVVGGSLVAVGRPRRDPWYGVVPERPSKGGVQELLAHAVTGKLGFCQILSGAHPLQAVGLLGTVLAVFTTLKQVRGTSRTTSSCIACCLMVTVGL